MKCEKGLTFEECELAILRHSVDKIEKKTTSSKKTFTTKKAKPVSKKATKTKKS